MKLLLPFYCFPKKLTEVYFVLQKKMIDYCLDWWSPSAQDLSILFSYPCPAYRGWKDVMLLTSCLFTCLALWCRAEWQSVSAQLTAWHRDRRLLVILLPVNCQESSQPAAMKPETFLYYPEIFWGEIQWLRNVNKFHIIDANRCSLASILDLTWLQNDFANLHILGLARLLSKEECPAQPHF